MTKIIPTSAFDLPQETLTKIITILNTKLHANINLDSEDREQNITNLCKYLNENAAFDILFDSELETEDIMPDETLGEVDINNYVEEILKQRTKQIEENIEIAKKTINSVLEQINTEPENQELYEYLEKNGSNFKSKHKDFLIINFPYDFDRAVAALQEYDYPEIFVKERYDHGEPIVTYYFNEISSLENIYESLHKVYKDELKPFKIHFQLSGIFETSTFDFETYEEKYDYEAREIRWQNYKSAIPIIVKDERNLEECKMYIETVLNSYETTSSNNKLTIVHSISFTVSRMRKVTGHIKNLPQIFKNNNNYIIVDDEDDNLCWYRFLACCLYPELTNPEGQRKSKNMVYTIEHRTKRAKKLLLEEHNITYTTKIPNYGKTILAQFQGSTTEDMMKSAEKHKINVNIYEYNNDEQYDLQEQWYFNEEYPTFSALLFAKDRILHIMFIKDAEKLTAIHVCPKCKSYVHYGHSNLKRFEDHIKHCDGKFKKQFVPNKEALPYCPHILNNTVYEYCLAHDLEWKPNIYYMTYDFETMEQVVNEEAGKSTFINSKLIPLSVSSCVKSASGLTTKNFSLRDSKDFIPLWLNWLFEESLLIYEDKLKYSCVPENIDPNINTITVFGFNSSRFDSNLFKKYLNMEHWSIDSTSIIGTLSSLKQFILTSSKYHTSLRFIDAQAFVAGGTLKQFGADFGGQENSVKGIFPYEVINNENYNEVLSKTEPFAYEDFYSYLNQNNPLSKKDYEEYVKDSKNYKNRWEYLLAYNDNDVEMMIRPIDNLIKMNAEYKVDMISNLSLSKCSACIKYALAYKNFDPHVDYDIINKENTFKPTSKWWRYKCESYFKQDQKYNQTHATKPRNLEKCISVDDYDKFLKIYENSCCHLCGEHFTNTNKPTLDRINNDIGHELENCKLACAECNKLRKRDDPKITRLRTQLKKFCKLHHLPTLINDEQEYYSLRNNITGGLSNVQHRYNIKGETHINKFRYDAVNNKVISYDTQNIMTHVVGVDFNSLYPSSFSSTKHDFNKYHGGVMYMPGSFRYRIDVKDAQTKQKAINIITSKTRFQPNPKYLFKAEVKLVCPANKINYFINFPPVFRNINIKNNEDTIGSYMYSYLQKHKLASLDKEERKLTMLLDTYGEYMTFSNYYLWFLLDHGLVLEDVKSVSIYEAHTGFHEFVTTFMKKRQDIIAGKVTGNEKFYKISMNGSYGYDGMNSEKFCKVKICDTNKAYQYIISQTYMNGAKLSDDLFIIQQQPRFYHCTTCLQESFWTLDNSKFWYLTFYYDFMNRCLDMNKLHYIEGDSDSAYFAISGNKDEPPSQLFNNIIKDKEFYNKHIYKFLPNPKINTVEDEKKILGCAIERIGDNMIALAPKCYTIWNNDETVKAMKLKGVSLKKNKIMYKDYGNIITNQTIKPGINVNLQMKNNTMSKVTVNKNALTGLHTKMIVLENQACAPFITGLTAKDYSC